jgi:uncharacterized RDD family membrane protein YckC
MARSIYGGEEATFTRRFFGDDMLESVLQVCTLGIGWLIWLAIVAPKGQTPAKQLLNIRIHDYRTGEIASAGQVWIREVGVKLVLPLAIYLTLWAAISEGTGNGISSLYGLVVGIALIANDERRALWDYIAGTIVRYHPGGKVGRVDAGLQATTEAGYRERRLQELELLHRRGILNDDEYRVRRAQIIAEV